jgi:precorrin-3B C17-methyltransferase
MGKLYLVGIGPGEARYMTAQAREALDRSEVFCGYTLYLEQVHLLYPQKETFSTPMRGELDRCRHALELAAAGKTVALICGGDAGVYGLASPTLELLPAYPGVEVELVAGVTAALAGAAALGAPLGHDFCVISLSDLLTPWETIENRLRKAAQGDFVIVLYNPASHRRAEHLRRACDVLLETRRGETLCGLARQVGRAGQETRLLTLAELRETRTDMLTTVFVGSSTTREVGGYLVTPRGYGL